MDDRARNATAALAPGASAVTAAAFLPRIRGINAGRALPDG